MILIVVATRTDETELQCRCPHRRLPWYSSRDEGEDGMSQEPIPASLKSPLPGGYRDEGSGYAVRIIPVDLESVMSCIFFGEDDERGR